MKIRCTNCRGNSPSEEQMDRQVSATGDPSGACGTCNNTHEVEVAIGVKHMDRAECVRLLEGVSIQCYDHESVETLREAVRVNLEDGTIDPIDLLDLE